ncbi:MAG: hypothetical protein JEZ04_03900 [Spirochaetales bacterium]|nr:hypothetical protein [Spirochaetales bacterium]
MAINFSKKRREALRETYRKWWAGELKRPIAGVTLINRDPGRARPPAPVLSQRTCLDFQWSAEEIIDRLDYELCRQTYLGDAFPFVNLDCFGPGVASAFMGARADNSTGGVWFEPVEEVPISKLHLEYDALNPMLLRIKDICRAAVKRWENRVVVGMADLGGTLDILQIFRPGEKLLLDFYDYPEEVHRLSWEIHHLWHRYYSELHEILQEKGMGYSDWSGIYSDKPFYTLQCDISYMISTDMFREFALSEIEASVNRLGRSVYHLDGTGALKHLDTVLSMNNLSCVQWIPGDGNPTWGQWPDVYRKISGSGKKIQSMGSPVDDLLKIVIQTGKPGLIQHNAFLMEKSKSKEIVIEGDRVLVPSSMVILIRVFFALYRPVIAVLRFVICIRHLLGKK